MRRLRPVVPRLALVVLVPFLLGVKNCDSSPVTDFLNRLAQLVTDLEQRVAALEACECGGVLAPVCGEDGVTYVNACKARCADVRVAYVGECEPSLCHSDRDCARDEFCEFESCLTLLRSSCEADVRVLPAGECVAVPSGCPEIYAPVCGCDGVTYDNDCFRREARVSKDRDGTCEEPPPRCGGIAGFECPSQDQVCIFEPGTCDVVDNMGECVERPETCDRCADPVCGCDGRTYINPCLAVMAGVSIDYTGPCEPEPPAPCGGIAGFECPSEDQVCIFEPGTCDVVDNMGECVERPESCLVCPENSELCHEVHDPVCGCDGNTYENPCRALMAGVSIDHKGACQPPVCGGIEDIPCAGPRHACIFPPGMCQVSEAEGECVELPEICPLYYDPVCGCDGKSYSNACSALGAGVSILHEGECGSAGN